MPAPCDNAGMSEGEEMLLQEITDEKDLKDGRTYLCCTRSRHGNAIWQTFDAQKHRLMVGKLPMPMKSFAKVFDLPKGMADIAATQLLD